MKKEDTAKQSLNEVEALYYISGSDHDASQKKIKALCHPGLAIPLVGLLLLAALPFGASIKQSFPRAKFSHRGKT